MKKNLVNYSKQSLGNDAWAELKNFLDPVSGMTIENVQSPKPIGGLDRAVKPFAGQRHFPFRARH
jgi:hypothetical protein